MAILHSESGLPINEGNPMPTSVTGSAAKKVYAVTPHDTNDLANYAILGATIGLYVGVTGNVAVVTDGDTTITFVGLASGIIHPIAAKKVLATGTDATSILAVY